MSLSVVTSTDKYGESNMEVVLTLTCTGECSQRSGAMITEDLVKVRFLLDAKLCTDGVPEVTYKISLSKCDRTKNQTIKTNITCENLNYYETGINTPKNWSSWIVMGTKKLTIKFDKPLAFYAMLKFMITIYEVKMNNISPILHSDAEFTDFCLSTAEGSVPVHKACLASHSDVFKAMLKNEWKERTECHIKIKGVNLKTLQQLKDYMYLGTLPKDDTDGLRPLLLIARCYLIEDLEKHCLRMLAETVTPEELFSLIDFACENQIPELPFTLLQLTKDSVIKKAQLIKKKAVLGKQTDTTDG